ncbi:MAG: DNA-binding domain-containing protein [Fibrobacterota bacterium]|nr:DNA-binding domain-containing protein [Fibrobacterota bacterium]
MQEEFGRSIRTPFSFSTGRFQCRMEAYSEWITDSILPRGKSDGQDRLSIYNEQYWYRLLTVLQEDFTLLAETMGLWSFNQLATAYLHHRPSRSPYLQNLPDGFAEFIRGNPLYNIPRLIQIADLEMAFLKAFHAPSQPSLEPGLLNPSELEMLADLPLAFQPWLSLVEEDWNYMESRVDVLPRRTASPTFSEKKGYWAVFRAEVGVKWIELDSVQFGLLTALQLGRSLGEACEVMAAQLSPQESELFSARISTWFETWTRLKFFIQPSFEALEHR